MRISKNYAEEREELNPAGSTLGDEIIKTSTSQGVKDLGVSEIRMKRDENWTISWRDFSISCVEDLKNSWMDFEMMCIKTFLIPVNNI